MKKLVVLVAFLASCEPFSDQRNDMQPEEARAAFDHWRDLMIAGKMAESLQMMTWSYKSQWIFDRLKEGDFAALSWKTRLQGNARTDLDLWYPEAAKAASESRGRVQTLPRAVIADGSLTALLAGYLQDAALDIRYEFRKVEVVKVTSDEMGISVLVHNSRGEPEMYAMIFEGGIWKLDHHKTRPLR